MRIFLDANILVSVLNKEYPLFTYAARIVSLADHNKFTVCTSPVCLAIAFYFSEKKSGTELAKQKIRLLSEKLTITAVGKNEVVQALENKQVNDFEDGIEYYAAVNNKCTVIITEDTRDFYFAGIKVCNALDFLQEYLF
ncbi:MAG: PIN domain-containing protein [Ferruginibacter sp.]|nr:PIN domain-containing protein [Chitinophagaceae bacterium]